MTQASVFISYSYKDEKEKDELLTHLGVLQGVGLIQVWSDDRIGAGDDWRQEIDQAIGQARVAILLISANFLTSDFILNQEVPALLRRHESEGLIIFPLIAKACAWRVVDWLAKMQVRLKDERAIWSGAGLHTNEALAAVAEEVAAIVKGKTNVPISGAMNNLYTHLGKPIRASKHFYGRQREVAHVANDIHNRQCVSVVGIRRIGKTSLLFQLLNPSIRSAYELSDDVLCVYINCERLTRLPADEIYGHIMDQIYRQLKKRRQAGLLHPPEKGLSFYDFENKLLELLKEGLKPVLLLDEFERLAGNPQLDVTFFLGLRALHIEHEITYVTASQHPLLELAFSDEDTISSPFPNIFDSVRVGLFPEVEAQELIQVAGLFSPETEDFLLDLAGGHPLALQQACYYAFKRQQETGQPLTRDDLFVVWDQTQEVMESQYRYYWKQLNPAQKRILAAPTHFSAQVKDSIPVENLFKDLITMGLLIKRDDGSFGYAGRVLAEFVRRERMRDKSF